MAPDNMPFMDIDVPPGLNTCSTPVLKLVGRAVLQVDLSAE